MLRLRTLLITLAPVLALSSALAQKPSPQGPPGATILTITTQLVRGQ